MSAEVNSPSNRRSSRIPDRVAVTVQGMLAYKIPFQEETETLVISVHGALVLLGARVTLGQKLTLVHKQTQGEQECAVAYLGPAQAERVQVGLKFSQPNPNFWRALVSPED